MLAVRSTDGNYSPVDQNTLSLSLGFLESVFFQMLEDEGVHIIFFLFCFF